MIRLNDINLQSISLRGRSLSRISLGGSSGSGVPPVPALRPIASYRTAGKTNEDTDRTILKDLSGNGHDIVLKNFGFAFGSGYGVYDTNVTSIVMNSSNYSLTVKPLGNPPKIRIAFSVSGLPNKDTGYNYLRISVRGTDQTLLYNNVYRYNGEYVFEWENTNNESFYCVFYNGGGSSFSIDGLKILIHPNAYEGALVFDGIDDYGICENFPAIQNFTLIYKRVNFNPSKKYFCFLSKCDTEQVTYLCVEFMHSDNNYVRIGNKEASIKDVYNPELSIVYVTNESYDGKINLASSTYEPVIGSLFVGTFAKSVQSYAWNGALYALDIYDRILTEEEIQKVMDQYKEEYPELFPDQIQTLKAK